MFYKNNLKKIVLIVLVLCGFSQVTSSYAMQEIATTASPTTTPAPQPVPASNDGFRTHYKKTLENDLGYYAAKMTIGGVTLSLCGCAYWLYSKKQLRHDITLIQQNLSALTTALHDKTQKLEKLINDHHDESTQCFAINDAQHALTHQQNKLIMAQNVKTHEALKLKHPEAEQLQEQIEAAQKDIAGARNQLTALLHHNSGQLLSPAAGQPIQSKKSWVTWISPRAWVQWITS